VTGPVATSVASRQLRAADLPGDGSFHEIALPFELTQMELSVQFRLRSTGRAPLAAFCHVGLDRLDQSGLPTHPRIDAVHA
jgi:hypothetical protein